jgi:hypothetical protein
MLLVMCVLERSRLVKSWSGWKMMVESIMAGRPPVMLIAPFSLIPLFLKL